MAKLIQVESKLATELRSAEELGEEVKETLIDVKKDALKLLEPEHGTVVRLEQFVIGDANPYYVDITLYKDDVEIPMLTVFLVPTK